MSLNQLTFFCVLVLLVFHPFIHSSASDLYWETIFYSNTTFRYSTSNQCAPGPNWRNLDFNAENCISGTGGIGYDDNTIIATTNALFLQRNFTIYFLRNPLAHQMSRLMGN